MDRAMPEISGYGKIASNLGEIANQGAELTLSSVNINTSNVRWNTTFTYSTNKNEIKHLYGDMIDVLDADGNVIGQREDDDVQNGWYIGHAIDEIYDYKWIGVWQLGEELEAANMVSNRVTRDYWMLITMVRSMMTISSGWVQNSEASYDVEQ